MLLNSFSVIWIGLLNGIKKRHLPSGNIIIFKIISELQYFKRSNFSKSNSISLIVKRNFQLNRYNFVGIHLNKSEKTLTLYVNEWMGQVQNQSIEPLQSFKLSIYPNQNVVNPSEMYAYCMGIGTEKFTQAELMETYAELLKGNEIWKRTTGISYYNPESYQNFEVVDLNGTFFSNEKRRPVDFSSEKEMFVSCPQKKRKVYQSYKGLSNLRKASWIGYVDNMGFIISNSLSGAKFIDKGFDATRSIKVVKMLGKEAVFIKRMSRFTIYSERFLAQTMGLKNLIRLYQHIYF